MHHRTRKEDFNAYYSDEENDVDGRGDYDYYEEIRDFVTNVSDIRAWKVVEYNKLYGQYINFNDINFDDIDKDVWNLIDDHMINYEGIDDIGRNFLCHAIEFNYIEKIKIGLDNNNCMYLKSSYGFDAMGYAKCVRNPKIQDLLKNHGYNYDNPYTNYHENEYCKCLNPYKNYHYFPIENITNEELLITAIHNNSLVDLKANFIKSSYKIVNILLYETVDTGDFNISILDFLLEHNADKNYIHNGDPIICIALSNTFKPNAVKYIKKLLTEENINRQDTQGNSPLMITLMNSNINISFEIFNILIENNANIYLCNNKEENILHLTARITTFIFNESILKKDLINKKNIDDETPLFIIAKRFYNEESRQFRLSDLLEYFIKMGANPFISDKNGIDTFEYVLSRSHNNKTSYLLDNITYSCSLKEFVIKKIDYFIKNNSLKIFKDILNGNEKIKNYIKKENCIKDDLVDILINISSFPNFSCDEVSYSDEFNCEYFITILKLDCIKNNINQKDRNGNTILLNALNDCKCSTKIVEQIIELGADLNILNNKLESPLHKAALKNNIDIVKMVYTEENKNKQDIEGITPLHNCTKNENYEITEFLLSKKCDPLNYSIPMNPKTVEIIFNNYYIRTEKDIISLGSTITSGHKYYMDYINKHYDNFNNLNTPTPYIRALREKLNMLIEGVFEDDIIYDISLRRLNMVPTKILEFKDDVEFDDNEKMISLDLDIDGFNNAILVSQKTKYDIPCLENFNFISRYLKLIYN